LIGQNQKNWGSTPKGYAWITAPGASYAVGFLPRVGISAADAADCAWLTIKTLVNVGRWKLVSLRRWLTSTPALQPTRPIYTARDTRASLNGVHSGGTAIAVGVRLVIDFGSPYRGLGEMLGRL